MNDKAEDMESQSEEQKEKQKTPPVKDQLVQTSHTVVIDGRKIDYTVTCGTMVLKEEVEKGEKEVGEWEGEQPKAAIFFVAYTRDDTTDLSTRPISFSFNGGPGSSSVWLHLGALGPRRVLMSDEGWALPPPYRLVENEFSLLDKTDLVFIDPVSTGYSRPVPGEKQKRFHGFKKDIESVGDFIRLYTSRYGRWGSPKFLIGESYGTTRAAGLSGYLQERHGMYLNGLILVSVVLNFQTLEFEPGNDLPYLLILPTYTATAWYHRRLPDDLQGSLRFALDQAERFAVEEYNGSLVRGESLSDTVRENLVEDLARFTGLSNTYVDRSDLRVEIFRFTKELLRDQRRTVGRLDSRFTGIDRDAVGERPEHDPSMSAIMGPYTAAFNHYIRQELGFESDLPYETLNPQVWPWSYAEHENRYLDVAETLRKAMTANPYLKVLVANGYFDLATPYFATQYTFNHLGLDPSLRENISLTYYEAGHMMYLHRPSLEKLKSDMSAFIDTAVPGQAE